MYLIFIGSLKTSQFVSIGNFKYRNIFDVIFNGEFIWMQIYTRTTNKTNHPSSRSFSNSEDDIFRQIAHLLPTIRVLSDASTDCQDSMIWSSSSVGQQTNKWKITSHMVDHFNHMYFSRNCIYSERGFERRFCLHRFQFCQMWGKSRWKLFVHTTSRHY